MYEIFLNSPFGLLSHIIELVSHQQVDGSGYFCIQINEAV